MKDIFLQHINELITGVIAIMLGWFGKSKLTKKEAEADILDKVQGIYDKMIGDTKQRMIEMLSEIEELKRRQSEIDENWKKKLASVEQIWQNKYNNLKNEFERYKKKHK